MWFAIKGIPPCYRDEHMNNITGRDLFRTLVEDILNSELTDEQLAYFALQLHRMFTVEINEATTTILYTNSTIKSVQAHTKQELAKLEKCKCIEKYKQILESIKKKECDNLKRLFNSLFIQQTKHTKNHLKFCQEYYISQEYQLKDTIEADIRSSEKEGSIAEKYSATNTIRKIDKDLRGFETKNLELKKRKNNNDDENDK